MPSDFHDWDDLRAELHDGDDEALEAERARTEAWIGAFRADDAVRQEKIPAPNPPGVSGG